ncbi:hypothetical protein OG698_20120 [Streptomyces sp. NBC_01003]|uniref:hypothetical protein n=1 Tax=Streptomyces sp. NBC_01003 TaxID=2903714 RepID=UPI003867268F|nr:hypothetical protein OG698_20120 [Streptomyces sp. NBC_01003]
MQIADRGRLRWEFNWSCSNCGIESDDGDWGQAPSFIRDLLLAEHGSSCIKAVDPDASSGKIMKAFRDIFGESMPEAMNSAIGLKATGRSGTHVGIRLLEENLAASGIGVQSCGPELV